VHGIGEAGIEIREMAAGDEPAVLELLAASLGWVPDEDYAALFAWKHRANPFGPSPAWVAVGPDGALLGFRTFLRWEFEEQGRVVRAVRAVDTATHPDARGRGVFTRLTRHALDAVAAEGVWFVFNTPNAQSRPGYLKMGWVPVGRLPVRARPVRAGGLVRMLGARAPAERAPVPTEAGDPAAAVLADDAALGALLASLPSAAGLRTRRTPAYLRWRYAGLAWLGYRAVTGPTGPSGGLALFRLRRRGPAVELAVAEVLAPEGDPRLAAALLRRALAAGRSAGADYAVGLGPVPGAARAGMARIPRTGPLLTYRGLARPHPPALPAWELTLGDIELF
jgi:GNAT superfamily N-acetyltransferase